MPKPIKSVYGVNLAYYFFMLKCQIK